MQGGIAARLGIVGTLNLAPIPTNSLLPVACTPIVVDETIRVGGKEYVGKFGDFDFLLDIGHGAHGMVQKYRHRPSNTMMAIKRVACPARVEDRTYVDRELQISRKVANCPHTVAFYGAFHREGDLWLCMALMDTSLDTFYKVLNKHSISIPEDIIGNITVSLLKALAFLKSEIEVIHRDVKPSNILLGRDGSVKLCDYSIAGYLVSSLASTMNVGYVPYLAPERIHRSTPDNTGTYDIRSDIWSVGISLVEVATGQQPFVADGKKTMFQQMMAVVQGPPVVLPADKFTPEFCSFVDLCVKKKYEERPKYDVLLQHVFVTRHDTADAADNTAAFVKTNLAKFAAEFKYQE